MSRRILFSVVLVLLLYPCTSAVGQYQQGSVLWPNWANMPGGPSFSFNPRSAQQGTPDQNQGVIGFQLAYANSLTGQSGIRQITIAQGEQFQNANNSEIQQNQGGNMLVGQTAGTIGAGLAGGIQHFDAHQFQSASSPVGQSTQISSVGVTQFSHVVGTPGSGAFAGGRVVVSTEQTQYIN